jgi:hypothetical protein
VNQAYLGEDITCGQESEIRLHREAERKNSEELGKLQFLEQGVRYGIRFQELGLAEVIRKWSVTMKAPIRTPLPRQDF